MKKRVIPVLLLLIFTLSLTACSSNEIDKKTIIDGILVSENEFVFITAPQQNALKIKGEDLSKALSLLEVKTGKSSYLGQNSYIIFHNTVDFSKAEEILNYLSSNFQVSPNTRVLKAHLNVLRNLCENVVESENIVSIAKDNSYKLYNVINELSSSDSKELIVPVLVLKDDIILASYPQ